MQRKLTKVGNSQALTLSRDMKDHLGVTEFVEVSFVPNGILLSRPQTIQEAAELTEQQYDNALQRMADAE